MSAILGFLSAIGGLIVFAGAWHIHQKTRLTRAACIMAAIGGFMTYETVIGTWLNRYAVQVGVIAAVAVVIGICVIVADIKGKKKGADKPALVAFFLVPIFLVAGLSAVPPLVTQAGNGLEKVSSNVSTQMGK